MTIRYIIGRAGTGTDRTAIEEIGRELRNGCEQKIYLFVPEQYTLQAERNLISQLKLPGIIKAEVLSLNRLAYRVLNETGGRTRVVINEQGRSMVIKKVINDVTRDLSIYKKASRQEGFIEELSDLFANFKQYDLDPSILQSKQNEIEDDVLRLKLKDISLIYAVFTDYMASHYLDMEDQLNLFIEKLDDSVLLKDTRIWLDKFSYFPPQNLRIIEKMMLQARDTTFCLTLDPQSGRDKDTFKISQSCYEQLHALAVRHGLREERIELTDTRSCALAPLKHLEQELYAYPHKIFTGEVKNMEIFAAANIYSEAEHVAARIVKLVQDQGWRWRDITVLSSGLDTYGPIISRVFNEYRIPFFLDTKLTIDNHPLIKMILSSLAVINRGYRADDIFMLMKSGFTDLTPDECEEIENYMLAYGIKGRLFQEDFSRGQDEIEPQLLASLNHNRLKLISPLQKLEKSIKGKKTGRELSLTLFHYLQTLDIEQKLQDWTDTLRRDGLYEYVLGNGQIWNIVMQTFDQLVEILGDNEINLKEFTSLLETGYKSFSVGIIPTTVDQIMIGNIKRSKSHSVKAVFVMGTNDGILPAGTPNQIIFTEEEKQILHTNQLEWDLDQQSQSTEEEFDIYLAFSQADEFLSLSYAIADQEGKALRPSLLINRVKTLYPKLKTRSDLLRTPGIELEQLVTPTGSFKYLAEKLRLHLDGEEINDFWWDVYDWYYHHPEWENRRINILDALFYQNQVTPVEQVSAGKLYKTPFYSSVSRLEQFAACPFAHFVRYGLRPQERRSFAVGLPDIGILLHEGLAEFSTALGEQGIDWRNISRSECDDLIDKIMAEQLVLHNNGIMMSSYRYRYLAQRLKKITHRAVWTLTEHIQRGEFEPYLYEARFGSGGVFPPLRVDLNNEQSFYLEGRIDRIDILHGEDSTYFKIIDYKSGERQLNLSELYFGLNLQLFVYLLAVLKAKKPESDAALTNNNYKPAALFYFKIDDPLINVTDMDLTDIEDKIRKKLRMNGLVLKDVELVRAMDRDLQGNSDILPLGIKNNGEFSAASSVLEAEEFDILFDYLQELLKEIGTQMVNGQIRIEPVKTDKWKACDRCIYHAICQFDKMFAANRYKNILSARDADILDKIKNLREDITHE
ncbi:MAG: addB [Firmicutes bacterium]|nr:addB [Bacillota bacterium]